MNRTKTNKPRIEAKISPGGFSAKISPAGPTPEDLLWLKGTVWMWAVRQSFSGEVEWSGPGLDAVGDELKKLLLPVVALKVCGSVAQIAAQIADVTNVIKVAKDFPAREQLVSDLEKFLADDLEIRRAGMTTAEKILADAGWKFNSDSKKASRAARRHKGKDLLVECVWAIYTAKYKGVGNTLTTRRKIKDALAPYFDAEELRTESTALIYHAIRKGETRLR